MNVEHGDQILQFVIDKQGNQDLTVDKKKPEPIIYQRDTPFIVSPRKRKLENTLQSTETEIEDAPKVHSATCFNCEGPHNMRECPFPINRQVVAANRRAFLQDKPKDRRYWEEDKEYNFEVGVLSPQLKLALGIDDTQEPPYISKMFQHGFPPAYTKKGSENPFYAKYQAMVQEASEWYETQIADKPAQQPTQQTLQQHQIQPVYQQQQYQHQKPQQQYQYQKHQQQYQAHQQSQHTDYYQGYYTQHYQQQQQYYYQQYEYTNFQSNPHDSYPRTTFESPSKPAYPLPSSISTTPITPTKAKDSKQKEEDSDMEVEEGSKKKKKVPPVVEEELEEGEIPW
mmetsp:Transcript_7736/g.10682  ORF Transcript_7736/g.10682 Transcript_7736/m.10682 type:complete len:340 (-) Transcript_7736:145-1164(-)